MRKPSKKVLTLFADVEKIAAYMLELTAEEARLREALEKLWRTRAVAMSRLAETAAEASQTEVAEATARRKR